MMIKVRQKWSQLHTDSGFQGGVGFFFYCCCWSPLDFLVCFVAHLHVFGTSLPPHDISFHGLGWGSTRRKFIKNSGVSKGIFGIMSIHLICHVLAQALVLPALLLFFQVASGEVSLSVNTTVGSIVVNFTTHSHERRQVNISCYWFSLSGYTNTCWEIKVAGWREMPPCTAQFHFLHLLLQRGEVIKWQQKKDSTKITAGDN